MGLGVAGSKYLVGLAGILRYRIKWITLVINQGGTAVLIVPIRGVFLLPRYLANTG